MTTSASPSLSLNPSTRIQLLFENERGQPTKEFNAGDLSELTFDALVAKAFAMSLPNETARDEYSVTFKYQIEERHESRWVNFENTEGLGYAFQSSHDKGYVFISASIIKKGAVALVPPSPVVSPSKVTKTTKPKVAKKAKTTKAKAPSPRGTKGGKVPVEQRILSSLKELLDLGITAPPRSQIALFSGYSNVQSASFKKAMKNLNQELGFIDYPDKDTVRLTATGTSQAPSAVAPATSNHEIQERLKKMLKDKAPAIFDQLKDGRSHAREQVAATVGYSNMASKGFKDAVKQMLSLNMIEESKEGKKKLIQLTDIAFPFGRPGTANGGIMPDLAMSIVSNDNVATGF